MNFSKMLLLVLAVLAITATSKLSVIGPSSLAKQFDGIFPDDVDFALSHYGNIPFGAHFVGKLFLATPIEGCNPIDPFSDGEKTPESHVIAVVRRGGCRVSVKSRNGQLAGAKVVIIVNDREDDDLGEYFGHEHETQDIKIPTLLIDKKDGDKLIEFLTTSMALSPDNQSSNNAIVMISFPFDPKSDTVNLDFWYSSADSFRSSFLFLKRFYDQWNKNKEIIKFTPHFVTWTCGNCKNQNFQVRDEPDCISGGRYCSPAPDESGKVKGGDVVREDLRQSCVYKTSPDLWWNYVIAYGEKCIEDKDPKNCGDLVLSTKASQTERSKVNECIQESFELPAGSESRPIDQSLDDNKILREEKELQLEYAIHQYPALFINHKPFYGKLHHAYLVFEEVCRNFNNLPDDCKVALSRTGENTSEIKHHHVGRIIMLVTIMTLLAGLIFYCCKKMIKKESRDISMEVGGMVTKYFALKDTTEGANDEEAKTNE